MKEKRKKQIRKIWFIISLILACLFIIPVGRASAAAAPKLSKTSTTLYVGYKQKLTVKNTKAKVSWKSSKTKVVTVTSNGTIKGVGVGTAKITATVSGKKLSCVVKVINRSANAVDIVAKTADGGDFVLGESTMNISFKLDATSTNVKVQILDLTDCVLYTKTFPACKKDTIKQFSWDGKNSAGQFIEDTTCKVKITAGKIETVSTSYFKTINAASTGFSGGNGSESNPYLVETLEQLQNVGLHSTRCFKQTADINGNYASFEAMGGEDLPFTGNYDGDGHTISNLMIKDGIFAVVGEDGVVENMNFSGCTVTESSHRSIGVLAAKNHGVIQKCTFKNCTLNLNNDSDNWNYIGTVCGVQGEKGSILNCSVDIVEIASSGNRCLVQLGGIVGDNLGKVLDVVVNNSSVSSTGGNDAYYRYGGGIAGSNDSTGIIANSQVLNGTVKVTGSHAYNGGIAGGNWGQILDCVATTVTEGKHTGVIAGKNEGIITNH